MAMVIFAKEKVDVMVIETGLGGHLDATNVLEKPAVCVIASISKDRIQYLGTTIPEIAGEKAGIIKAGVPVVFDDSDAEAGAVIRNRAKKMNAQCFPVSDLLYEAVNGAKEEVTAFVLKKKKIMDRLLVLTVQNLFLLFLLQEHLIRLRMHFLL